MKRIIIGCFLATFLNACAVERPRLGLPGGASASQEKVEAPEYKGGGSWTYRVVDKTYYDYRSDLLNGDFEITFQGGRPRFLRIEGDKKVGVAKPFPLPQMLPGLGVRRGPLQFFNFPLWIGKKWTVKYLQKSRKPTWRTAENAVTGMETVTTPAGTFRAFRIEREIYFPGGGFGSGLLDIVYNTWTYTYYYSPETRSVVKYSYREQVKIGISTIQTLIRTMETELIKYGSGMTSPTNVVKVEKSTEDAKPEESAKESVPAPLDPPGSALSEEAAAELERDEPPWPERSGD